MRRKRPPATFGLIALDAQQKYCLRDLASVCFPPYVHYPLLAAVARIGLTLRRRYDQAAFDAWNAERIRSYAARAGSQARRTGRTRRA